MPRRLRERLTDGTLQTREGYGPVYYVVEKRAREEVEKFEIWPILLALSIAGGCALLGLAARKRRR